MKHLEGARDVVHTDSVVSVAGEKVGAIGGPGEGSAVGELGVLASGGDLDSEFVDHALALKIPDLDARGGGGNEPVAVGGEAEGVDDVASLEGVEALALSEVPEHGNAVLSAGGAEGAIGGDGDGVEVAGVAREVGADLAVGEVPDLDELVPASGDDDGGAGRRRESDARDPLGVAILLDGVLALTEGVPELDSAIAGAGDDLSVVGGEGDGENILGVANEAASALAGLDLPEAESAVPRAREGELAIGGDHDVRDEVVVALKGTAGVAVVALLANKGPYDDGL